MHNILSTTSTFARESPELIETIRRHGLNYVSNPLRRKLTSEELLVLMKEHQPVAILAGTETIGQIELQNAANYLRVISRVGAGWDNIDLMAASELNILVYRTSGVLSQAVAELTIGFMIAALRNIPMQDRLLRGKVWEKRMGRLLQEKVVGVIGFGSIGCRVGELVHAFGATVLYCDPFVSDVSWACRASLSEILHKADIITIHADGKDKILGPDELQSIKKPGVILVNTARGSLIDEDNLVKCLEAGVIGFACLDVFNDEPYTGRLTSFDNVILTPHIGSYASEARSLMEKTAVENLLTGLRKAEILKPFPDNAL